ncbi:YihY/virulence factor BrkB family protein [Ferruginibacter sp. SUN002]|uniref:YihY/virulence factor BrkB family protein n=1 Tax=Ferruginibacter sp. SUN002 TaxID=2937789 RepID=UPI003D368348
MKKNLIEIYKFAKQVIAEFIEDNALKYSASLSYYTIFSLAPMMIIIFTFSGFLFSQQAMQGQIFDEIKNLVGSEAALQIQTTIKNIHLSKDTWVATTIGIITLIVGATGIFGEMQDSLNKIWGLQLKPTSGLKKIFTNRLLSFSLVLSLGFVLTVSLILNAIIFGLGSHLNNFFSGKFYDLIPFFENIFSFLVTTVLFAAIFKILPDAKIKWKDVFIGALVTSLLFMLGKFLIGYYLSASKLTTIYGAAGSVIIILLWTYYSSAILFMGAEFTKVYALRYDRRISPNNYSVWTKTEELPVENITPKKDVE